MSHEFFEIRFLPFHFDIMHGCIPNFDYTNLSLLSEVLDKSYFMYEILYYLSLFLKFYYLKATKKSFQSRFVPNLG